MPDWSFDPSFLALWAVCLVAFVVLPFAIAAALGRLSELDEDGWAEAEWRDAQDAEDDPR